MDHFRSDYAARHSIQTWKNVGVDFLNLSQFILQCHYVWCSDLNLVYKALHGFMDHLVNPPVHHSPCRTQSENMVVPGPSWLWSGFSANGRPWSDLPWHLSMSNFWFFFKFLPEDLVYTLSLSVHPWLWIWVSVTNLPVLRLMWNHVICSDENEKSEDAAEDSHPITPTLDGNNELRIIQPTSSSSPTVFPLFYLI